MATKLTARPLKCGDGYHVDGSWIVEKGRTWVATQVCDEQHAKLFAAAPAELAACKRLLNRVDAPGGTVRSITGDDIAAIRAAIALAQSA